MAAVEVRTAPGKGRGLFSTRPIAAGESFLDECPAVLTVSQALKRDFCSVCLRSIPAGKQFRLASVVVAANCAVTQIICLPAEASSACLCQSCQQACCCSQLCAAQHTPTLCRCGKLAAISACMQCIQGHLKIQPLIPGCWLSSIGLALAMSCRIP